MAVFNRYASDLACGGLLFLVPRADRIITKMTGINCSGLLRIYNPIARDWDFTAKIIINNSWVTFVVLSILYPNGSLGLKGLALKAAASFVLAPAVHFWEQVYNRLVTEVTYNSISLPEEDPIFDRFTCRIALSPVYPIMVDPSTKGVICSRVALNAWLEKNPYSPFSREVLEKHYLNDEANANILHRVKYLQDRGLAPNLKTPQEMIELTRSEESVKQLSMRELVSKYYSKSENTPKIEFQVTEGVKDLKGYVKAFRQDVENWINWVPRRKFPFLYRSFPCLETSVSVLFQINASNNQPL